MKREIILNSNPHKLIYCYEIIIVVAFILLIIISNTCSYKTFYQSKGVIKRDDDKNFILKLPIDIDEMECLSNNQIIIDNKNYEYEIVAIKDEEGVNNKKMVYLTVAIPKKYQIDNYILDVSLLKEHQKIIAYLNK